MTDTDTSAEAITRFIAQYKDGASGCHMDYDDAQGFAGDLQGVLAERDALRAEVAEARNAALEEAAQKMDRATVNSNKMSDEVSGVERRDFQTSALCHAYAAQSIRSLKTTEAQNRDDQ